MLVDTRTGQPIASPIHGLSGAYRRRHDGQKGREELGLLRGGSLCVSISILRLCTHDNTMPLDRLKGWRHQ